MTESTPFELSRIYASGWSAGRKCTADETSEIVELSGSLNPHQGVEERERWSKGFQDAAYRRITTPVKFRDRMARTGE